tara:strand:+ start:293 stop:592 length:300 start_codon:yes stop_codon:yes gene_type:complete
MPDVPAEPDEPLVPDEPLEPLEPLDPELPDEPELPVVPAEPAEPELCRVSEIKTVPGPVSVTENPPVVSNVIDATFIAELELPPVSLIVKGGAASPNSK